MQENEMTAQRSFAATNDERSPQSSENSVLVSEPLYKNNFEALELLQRYNESKKHQEQSSDLELIRADEIDPVSVREYIEVIRAAARSPSVEESQNAARNK